jgi:hypothetical protein
MSDRLNDPDHVDDRTADAETAEAARSHGADRGPTEEEERLADEAAATIDEAEVAKHEREMDELGADVKGEGEIK